MASTTMISRSMRRAVRGAMEASGATSASRFRPSGVSSNNQAKASAGRKPIASTSTMLRASHSGAPNIGSKVPATCTTSHAPTRYSPAMRMTLRRCSSCTSDMTVPTACVWRQHARKTPGCR